jgi:hypothetical protein
MNRVFIQPLLASLVRATELQPLSIVDDPVRNTFTKSARAKIIAASI